MSEKRNIVLITLDSVRADHCSFMGYNRKTTPTLDKMAKKGLYFENAIASGVPTLPSMFGVFTGEYALVNADVFTGKAGELWRKEISSKKTLASVLFKKGYNTLAFTANPFATSYFGLNKGFNHLYDPTGKVSEFDLGKEQPLAARELQGKGTGSFVNLIKDFFIAFKIFIKKERLFTPWEKYYETIIKEVKKSKRPYFLWILLVDTHIPYLPKIRIWSKTSLLNIYLSYKILRKAGYVYLSERETKWVIDAYDDAIRYADEFVNRLWNDLKDDDPIFIVHADHGEAFGEHNFYIHPPKLYEELVHVPLIIYNADVKGKIDNPVSLLGLSLVILELIGEKNEFPSKSLLYECDWVISKVFDRGKRKVAVRMKDWKFITGEKNEDELYYLKRDPYEQENLIEEHQDLAREIRKIVESHVKHEMEIRKIRDRVSKLKF